MTRQIPWARVMAEGVVIVGSILLAFGIDAWWNERLSRSDELVALQALREEFVGNLGDLEMVHAFQTSLAESADRLDSAMTATPNGQTAIVPDTIALPLVAVRTADPATGTLNMLLASGRIDLLGNQQLQQALAGWPAHLADAAEDEIMVRDFVLERLIPAMAEQADMPAIMAIRRSASPQSGAAYLLVGRSFAVNVNPLTRTLVAERAYLGRVAMSAGRTRLEEARRILELIESELE